MEAVEQKKAIYTYCRARHKADELEKAAEAAVLTAKKALEEMQEAWLACKGARPGIYAFEEMGRLAVVIDPPGDYPPLLEIIA